MRLLLLATATSLLVGIATFACSSSDPAPNADPSGEEKEREEENSEPPPAPETLEEDANAPPTDNDAGADASAPFDANFDAGILCMGADTKETEANDTPETADPLSGIPSVYCGRLAAGESDYATFTLNAASFTSSYAYSSAPITATATVEGQTFDLNSNQYVYKQGKQYVIKITAAAPTDYRLQLLP